jgi:PEP-CTERM motif
LIRSRIWELDVSSLVIVASVHFRVSTVSIRLKAWLSVAALSVIASSAWATPTLVGDVVSIGAYFPNLSTPIGTLSIVEVVTPGAECSNSGCLNLLNGESLNLEAQSISGTFTTGFDATGTFNGYVFDDLDFTEGGAITGVSLSVNSITGLTVDDITFDGDTVWVNLLGTTLPSSTAVGTFTIDLVVAPAAIPEPGALALAGLALAGLAVSRRRRQ